MDRTARFGAVKVCNNNCCKNEILLLNKELKKLLALDKTNVKDINKIINYLKCKDHNEDALYEKIKDVRQKIGLLKLTPPKRSRRSRSKSKKSHTKVPIISSHSSPRARSSPKRKTSSKKSSSRRSKSSPHRSPVPIVPPKFHKIEQQLAELTEIVDATPKITASNSIKSTKSSKSSGSGGASIKSFVSSASSFLGSAANKIKEAFTFNNSPRPSASAPQVPSTIIGRPSATPTIIPSSISPFTRSNIFDSSIYDMKMQKKRKHHNSWDDSSSDDTSSSDDDSSDDENCDEDKKWLKKLLEQLVGARGGFYGGGGGGFYGGGAANNNNNNNIIGGMGGMGGAGRSDSDVNREVMEDERTKAIIKQLNEQKYDLDKRQQEIAEKFAKRQEELQTKLQSLLLSEKDKAVSSRDEQINKLSTQIDKISREKEEKISEIQSQLDQLNIKAQEKVEQYANKMIEKTEQYADSAVGREREIRSEIDYELEQERERLKEEAEDKLQQILGARNLTDQQKNEQIRRLEEKLDAKERKLEEAAQQMLEEVRNGSRRDRMEDRRELDPLIASLSNIEQLLGNKGALADQLRENYRLLMQILNKQEQLPGQLREVAERINSGKGLDVGQLGLLAQQIPMASNVATLIATQQEMLRKVESISDNIKNENSKMMGQRPELLEKILDAVRKISTNKSINSNSEGGSGGNAEGYGGEATGGDGRGGIGLGLGGHINQTFYPPSSNYGGPSNYGGYGQFGGMMPMPPFGGPYGSYGGGNSTDLQSIIKTLLKYKLISNMFDKSEKPCRNEEEKKSSTNDESNLVDLIINTTDCDRLNNLLKRSDINDKIKEQIRKRIKQINCIEYKIIDYKDKDKFLPELELGDPDKPNDDAQMLGADLTNLLPNEEPNRRMEEEELEKSAKIEKQKRESDVQLSRCNNKNIITHIITNLFKKDSNVISENFIENVKNDEYIKNIKYCDMGGSIMFTTEGDLTNDFIKNLQSIYDFLKNKKIIRNNIDIRDNEFSYYDNNTPHNGREYINSKIATFINSIKVRRNFGKKQHSRKKKKKLHKKKSPKKLKKKKKSIKK